MELSTTSELKAEISELKSLVKNLLNKVEKQDKKIRKLTSENTALREEIRHLKKLKGKPTIRPNKKDPKENGKGDKDSDPSTSSNPDNTAPPKSKRQRSHESGRTSKPPPASVHVKACPVEGVQDGWTNKGYSDFIHLT